MINQKNIFLMKYSINVLFSEEREGIIWNRVWGLEKIKFTGFNPNHSRLLLCRMEESK